jgi:hypothetical protein
MSARGEWVRNRGILLTTSWRPGDGRQRDLKPDPTQGTVVRVIGHHKGGATPLLRISAYFLFDKITQRSFYRVTHDVPFRQCSPWALQIKEAKPMPMSITSCTPHGEIAFE